MTLRTKTLTAVAALTLSATGFALAQEGATTTVPMQQPGEAQTAPEGGTTFVATPETATETPAADGAAAEPKAEVEASEGEATAAEAEAEPEANEGEEAPAEQAEDQPADQAAAEQEPQEEATPEAEEAAVEETEAEPEAPAAEEAEAAAEEESTEEAPAEGEEQPAETEEAPADAEEEPAGAEEEQAAETDPTAEDSPAGEAVTAAEADTDHAGDAGDAHADAAAEDHGGGDHGGGHIEDVAFSFEGPFGKFDQFQLQRGLQVYTEVCSACHGMKFVPLRTLHDGGGPALPEEQVRAFAANLAEITDDETGEDRTRLPTDHFPEVTGDGMGPDLSLMAKARAGFHGPYGTGISQFFRGIGGPEYIHALLTGYTGEEKEEAGSLFYENTAFASGYISMPPPLSDDLVTYEDGTPATVDQMSLDVSAFLMWTAEPKMMDRKMVGLVSVLFLIVLTALLYLTNKRLWAPHKGKKLDH